MTTSKSLESSVNTRKKSLESTTFRNARKGSKKIQKTCSCMSLSTCFMKQNLPTEPFPWWFLEVFIPGLYRFQSTHPMLAHATSCKIVRPWFYMILLQKLRRRNPLKHGIHTLLADAQLNWTSILLKFGLSPVLCTAERGASSSPMMPHSTQPTKESWDEMTNMPLALWHACRHP